MWLALRPVRPVIICCAIFVTGKGLTLVSACPPPLSLCLCLSVSLCVSLSVSLTLSLSLCLSVSLSLACPAVQWNVDELSQIDKFLSVSDEFTKGGGLLGVGLCCSKVRNDIDPAFAVLSDYLDETVGHPKVRYLSAHVQSSRSLVPAV